MRAHVRGPVWPVLAWSTRRLWLREARCGQTYGLGLGLKLGELSLASLSLTWGHSWVAWVRKLQMVRGNFSGPEMGKLKWIIKLKWVTKGVSFSTP